jgi:hypothetical protein
MKTPAIGRIVHVLVDPSGNHGGDTAPAMITAVWGQLTTDTGQRAWSVNLRVIGDHKPAADEWKTSATLYADRAAAEYCHGNDDLHSGLLAYWPVYD